MWTSDHKCRYNIFTGGGLFWTATTGVCMIYGVIYKKWMSVGGVQGILGYPISDESRTPGGVTRFSEFSEGGAIYYTATRGAFPIYGDIYKKWYSGGGETGVLGYPISDEASTTDALYRFNIFSNGGAIYWTQDRCPVQNSGDIYKKWISLGGELSSLGYPLTDEREGRCNTRYSTFGGGSIWWYPSIGARTFCGRETKYNIAITTLDIHGVRSAFIDTLYIAACITTTAAGVKSVAIPLGDHTSVKLLDCPIADDEIATLVYIVIHNSSNDQADVIKKLDAAMLKIGSAVSEVLPNSLDSEKVIGGAIGTAIGTTKVPTDGSAIGEFAGWAESGGLGMSFLNCNGVVAARVVPLRGSDLKAQLISKNQWKTGDEHLGTASAEGRGPISHYNVSWNLEFA
ncbi:putative glucose sorbosone dehydrogenase protein [Rutstroemia sp. NJR-2017a WRK4]|nr:putative glucose sorbosone dehydrogenase protein [Rutstroemia sp. NJR-2017a WRK4]